jgi:phosphoribosylformylglycinamidine (FGAM) synthase-like enzyme
MWRWPTKRRSSPGKDSFFNEFVVGGSRRAIPTTLLISALSLVDDVSKLVTMDLKKNGNLLYVLGETRDEMGGSRYGLHLGTKGRRCSLGLNPKETWPLYERLSQAIQEGLVASCHDCSEGGLGVTLAEMAFGGGAGASVDLRRVPMAWVLVERGPDGQSPFSESNGRLWWRWPPSAERKFNALMKGLNVGPVGEVQSHEKPGSRGDGRKKNEMGAQRS